MLTVLLESRARRQRRLGSTVLSAAAHGAVIAAVVALTLTGRGDARPQPVHVVDTLRFLRTAPPPRASVASAALPHPHLDAAVPRPQLPTINVPITTPTTLPSVDLAAPVTDADRIDLGGSRVSAFSTGVSHAGAEVGAPAGVSDERSVDRAPRLLGRAADPRYPASLRAAGIEGHVLAEFVVDTLGRAELATLRFPELTNPLFGDAVRDALARYRFVPGELAGRKVRTRVAVPFEFRLER